MEKKTNIRLIKLLIILGIIGIVAIAVFLYLANKNSIDNKKYNEKYNKNQTNEVFVEMDKKPIIYLYPTEETDVSVVAKYPEKFTHTYPKYKNGWNVLAKPDGTLYDKETGRELYALYWEGIDNHTAEMEEGFCVKGEDTIEFLEEKLALLGLNEREAEEFIVYWLPILEENKYNYIHFLTTEKVESIMPLEITPEPDTRIRILMEYKALDKEIQVEEQKIETPERNGFVMVEWGGTEIK